MERSDGARAAASAAPAGTPPADPAWPRTPRRDGPAPPAGGYRMPASDVREDGPASAPDFSDSWSAGLASALEKADQSRAAAATAGGGADTKSKKKGRKGKSVLISGGLNF